MTIQLTINDLQYILAAAEMEKKCDNSLSNTIEFEIEVSTDLHTGSDKGTARLKSSYSECDGKLLYYFD